MQNKLQNTKRLFCRGLYDDVELSQAVMSAPFWRAVLSRAVLMGQFVTLGSLAAHREERTSAVQSDNGRRTAVVEGLRVSEGAVAVVRWRFGGTVHRLPIDLHVKSGRDRANILGLF